MSLSGQLCHLFRFTVGQPEKTSIALKKLINQSVSKKYRPCWDDHKENKKSMPPVKNMLTTPH